MRYAARVLACRSAPLAVRYAEQLQAHLAAGVMACRRDDPLEALAVIEAMAEPLERLLAFITVAGDLLRDAQHPLRGPVVRVRAELLAGLDAVEVHLEARAFRALAGVLQFQVIPTLREYASFGARVTEALRPRLAV